MLKLLAERILNGQPVIDKQPAIAALLQIADASIQAEQDHLLRSIIKLLAQTQDRLKSQVKERLDQVDTTFEGLSIEEEESEPRSPRQILDDLNASARIPLKLTADNKKRSAARMAAIWMK